MRSMGRERSGRGTAMIQIQGLRQDLNFDRDLLHNRSQLRRFDSQKIQHIGIGQGADSAAIANLTSDPTGGQQQRGQPR